MPSDTDTGKTPEDEMFVCRQCGDCCIGYGGTYVSDQDIERISDYIKVSPRRFIEQFCCLSGGKPLISQKDDGHCIFWDAKCTIHPVKPKMCRAWPYIGNLMVDVDNWNIMASMCPGMKKNASPHMVKNRVKKEIFNI